jgi:hypothetical protein
MNFAIEVIRHTPPFVWIIAVVVCLRAAQGLRTRWMKLRSLFLVPAIFILAGILGVSFRSVDNAIGWAVMATAFVPVGLFSAPHPLAIDRAGSRLQLGPSWVTAFRVPLIFVVRYCLAVAIAVRPDQAKILLLVTSVFSGGVVGYYVGWCAGLLRAYYRAPLGSADLQKA